MNAHTLGPWTWSSNGCSLRNAAGDEVLSIDLPDFVSYGDKALIAAVPDLLAEIKVQRCSYCGYTFGVPRTDNECHCTTCAPMVAAIAKAEGR